MAANGQEQAGLPRNQNFIIHQRLDILLQHLSPNIEPDIKSQILSLGNSKSTDSGNIPASWSALSVHGDGNYNKLIGDQKTRILILAPGQYHDDLQGHLKAVQCLEDHEYEAVSYAWGEEVNGFRIDCGGDKINITPNLDTALRRLRFTDKSRVLWIDAICINQKDPSEKSSQLRIIRQIYSNARRVLIWLGEQGTSESLLEFLEHLQQSLETRGSTNNFQSLGWYQDGHGQIYSASSQRGIFDHVDKQGLKLKAFLSRQWFHRTWIIQEVASAKHAVVICGSEERKWEDFADLCKWLGTRFLPFNQLDDEMAEHALTNIAAIEAARRSHSGPLELPLFHILLATAFSKCKDERDKIFAVMDLAKDWKDKSVLTSNYSTEVEKVYSEFAVQDCTYYRSLRILSCASGPRRDSFDRLPSWVPDWSQVKNAHPFVRYSDRTGFLASGNTKPEAWYSKDWRIFNVTGKIVDQVAETGPESIFSKSISSFELNTAKVTALEKSRNWLMSCFELALDGRTAMAEDRYNELWRTMTCGLTSDAFPAPQWYSKYFGDYMEFVKSAPERYHDYMIEAQSAPKGFRAMDEMIPQLKAHVVIESALHKWCTNRRLCKTKIGRLASIPRESEPGDIICVLYGAEVPYILRPSGDDSFEIVGECYVDDIMHGEILSDDIPLREIHLV